MEAAAAVCAETNFQSKADPNTKHIFQYAAKAFDLIHKYRTPPDPQTYAVWYAYAAGTSQQLVERVDELLRRYGKLSEFDIEALHRDLLAAETGQVATQHIGQAIEKEVEGVLKIIQQSVQNSDDFGASLNEATRRLVPHSLSGEDLAAIVSSLMKDNRRMAETTLELNQGLRDSQKQIASLHKELEEVQNQCLLDPLTSVYNRRAFNTRLEKEVLEAAQTGNSLCLAMADLDRFKRVNDTYGHQVGDMVLEMFADIITRNIKGQVILARYGGEEYAIILPQTDLFSAYNLLVKIKHQLKESDLVIDGAGRAIRDITASFGVARFEAGMNVKDLIEQADTYLYEAKNSGRDRVKAKGF